MRDIETILVMGGGELLWRYITHVRINNLAKVFLLSSKRHLDESIDSRETLRELVSEADISFAELPSLNLSLLEQLGFDPEKTVVFSFGAAWIIKQDVIDLFGGRIYNLHGTRLPQDRGGASLSWQIMRGNKYGFALMHQIDAGIDTGDIISYREFIYEGCQLPIDFYTRYLKEAFILLEEVTSQLLEGVELMVVPQTPYFSTYWPRLNTELQGWVDWSWSGSDILRFVRAFDMPYAGAHTLLDDCKVYLKSCSFDTGDGIFHPFQAGLIYRVTEEYIAVSVTTGSLLIKQMFDENNVLIPFSDIKLGSRLFTPLKQLELAKRTRVQYTSYGLRKEKENTPEVAN